MVQNFLKRHNMLASKQCYYFAITQWSYSTHITQENRDQLLNASQVFNEFKRQQSIEAKSFDWTNIDDYTRRQLEKVSVIGTAILKGQTALKLNEMQTIYSTANVCIQNKCGLELEPDLVQIMATSDNNSELLEAWVKWREVSGKQMRDKFITYYSLGNKAAKLNELPNQKFETLADLWLFQWETPDIKEQIHKLLLQLMPFYCKLHAYVRIKLNESMAGKLSNDLTIPAHLLGNMWAQQWTHTMKTVKGVDPYPQIQTIDVTIALKRQNYTSRQMFDLSNQFLYNLGLYPMTDKFWKNSVFEKPKNRSQMVCHASAWDFYNTDDFRIKQCTQTDMDNFVKIHHEMGHIQYFMLYSHQPIVFREAANPGFHEAIGDVLALSMALDKIPLLPFAYIMDKYRWDVFSGKIPNNYLNKYWWQLRGQYQGISPPVRRSERHFDAGAKYHIANGVEYIRYFVSIILQFQIHKALCSFGQKDVPLYECDIDGDKEAGNKLKQVLTLGSSVKWPKQLQMLTGNQRIDIKPMLDYFKPLQQFLDKQLAGHHIGWNFNVNDYFE
ncbi:angiotensin-converting enzyme-like [Oppia nitens]|uniref:angiotensin-converting enzyme-like n=1 Tax=Oppia nitens TaxID=1686743 RepID=UPI0023DB3089|nr:angiotensin-converting enzyme-like [Oppia nitens]